MVKHLAPIGTAAQAPGSRWSKSRFRCSCSSALRSSNWLLFQLLDKSIIGTCFQAMYIRVKRSKTTYFLQCDPTETILDIKQKLQPLVDHPANDQRLTLVETGDVLDDLKTLADQKVSLHFHYNFPLFRVHVMCMRNSNTWSWFPSSYWILITMSLEYLLFFFKAYLRICQCG